MVAAPLAVDVGETPPQGAGEQDTVQVTPLLLESPATVAVNREVLPAPTAVEAGATDTATEGTVMVAEVDFVLSVTEVAVNVTVKLLAGGLAGAV